MSGPGESGTRYGVALFLLLAIAMVAIAVIAAGVTGPMGIEERFNSAVGIHEDPGIAHEEEGSGFSIEGHPMFYAILLAVLVIACLFLYRKYHI